MESTENLYKNFLWVEKYRPKTLEDYVWLDKNLENLSKAWLKEGELPHLLLTGSPGTGKTSLVLLLLNLLDVDKSDQLFINASSARGIDTIRDLVQNFSSILPVGRVKYVILDEADSLTVQAQLSLRSLLETQHEVCRFIFTGNYENKIIEPLKSRCQHFRFREIDKEKILEKTINILLYEGLQEKDFNEIVFENITNIINKNYPDFRKIINLLQKEFQSGNLFKKGEEKIESDTFSEIVNLFKLGKIEEGRKKISENLHTGMFHDFYRYLYENLEEHGFKNNKSKANAIIKIAEGCKNHMQVIDQEINLVATLLELFFLKED